MKFSAAAVLLCLGAAVALASAQDDFDYGEDGVDAVDEKEARPPPPVAPRRPGVLSSGARKSPLARSRATASSTTPPPPPPPPQNSEEEELEEGEYEEEGEAPVTEASTKKPLIRGGVRPFRSNQDLLEALKRRRQNIKVSTHAPEDRYDEGSTTTAAPSRRRFNGNLNNGRVKAAVAAPSEIEEAAAPKARTGRRFNARGRVKEEEEQAPVVTEEPRRTSRRRF